MEALLAGPRDLRESSGDTVHSEKQPSARSEIPI